MASSGTQSPTTDKLDPIAGGGPQLSQAEQRPVTAAAPSMRSGGSGDGSGASSVTLTPHDALTKGASSSTVQISQLTASRPFVAASGVDAPTPPGEKSTGGPSADALKTAQQSAEAVQGEQGKSRKDVETGSGTA